MADSATLKIVIADDPSNAKPPSSRRPAGEAPAGTARESASGKSSGNATSGISDSSFADLAKSLGLTARELAKKGNEPGFRELIEQLPKAEASASRESVASSSSTGTAREQAAKPDTTPIDDAIDEVIERFKKGLLSLQEAQSRLDRFARNDKVVDQLRDAYGGNVDPSEHLRGRLQHAARDREVPTLAKPAQVEIIDEKRPTAGGARQTSRASETGGTPGVRSLLNELKPLLDQISGVGRALAALDKVGPAVERFLPGLGDTVGSLLGRGAAPSAARTAATGGEAAATAWPVAQGVPTAAPASEEAGTGAARTAATGGESAGAARMVAKAAPTAVEAGAGAEAGAAAGADEAGAAAGLGGPPPRGRRHSPSSG